MKTVQEVLRLSEAHLNAQGIPSARRQAEELLSHVLGLKRLDVYMSFERPLDSEEIDACRLGLARLSKREPWQYIFGEIEFFDCCIQVDRNVLIPRQETELLVEKIAISLKGLDLEGKVLWDLCCGSGCIGIALKKRYPALKVFSTDLSAAALEVAKANALKNQVELTFLEGDLLTPLKDVTADFVVCNPPYISEEEYKNLESEVRDYEPRLALVADEQGLSFYRRLASELKGKIHPGGKLWMELGTGQGEQVQSFFRDASWPETTVEKDWAGHDRFFLLENE